MRLWKSGAVAMLIASGTSALAASSADIAAALAPEVAQVISGGSWEDSGKKGGYRAVLVAAPAGAQLFVEWIAAGKDGGMPVLVATSPIKEVNDLRLPDAILNMEADKPNEFTVFVEPNDPGKDAGESFTIVATAPGKYTFMLGAQPE